MKRKNHNLLNRLAAGSTILIIMVLGLVTVHIQKAVAADSTSESNHDNSGYINDDYIKLVEFKQFFDDPSLIRLYSRAIGLHGNAILVQMDTTTDTTKVDIQVQKELEQARKELRRVQEELNKIEPEVRQEMEINMQELQEDLEKAMQELNNQEMQKELERLEKFDVRIYHQDAKPFIGISISDLDFKEAYERHYNYNYGVLISGVVDGTPADQAGLRKGDIIMEFNGDKARHRDILKNMIDSKSVGDTVAIKVFRDEEIFTTDLLLKPREPRVSTEAQQSEDQKYEYDYEYDTESDEDWGDVDWDAEDFGFDKESFLSKGYGGGGWIPVYSMVDLNDINDVIGDLGFNKFSENGILLQGGGGMGPVGKGWFVGGMGAGYSFDRKNTTTSRRMKFSTGYGGVTLDKRYRPSDNFVLATGILVGGAHTSLEVAQTQGKYDWNALDSTITSTGNSYLKMEKNYLMVQPRITMMYRILPWLAIRSEVGYLMGFSFQPGWEAKMGDETYNIDNSPASNTYQGLSFSIGPWFGF